MLQPQEKKNSLLWVILVQYDMLTLVADKSIVTLSDGIQNMGIVA